VKTHELKTWPMYFQMVRKHQKLFEVRKNDRGFKTGDTLNLREWDGEYTGWSISAMVSCMFGSDEIEPLATESLRSGYCVLGLDSGSLEVHGPTETKTKKAGE